MEPEREIQSISVRATKRVKTVPTHLLRLSNVLRERLWAEEGYRIRQMAVITDEEIYMMQPTMFEDGVPRAWFLQQALHDLKEAPTEGVAPNELSGNGGRSWCGGGAWKIFFFFPNRGFFGSKDESIFRFGSVFAAIYFIPLPSHVPRLDMSSLLICSDSFFHIHRR